MWMNTLMMGAIMGICVVIAHQFVQRRAQRVAQLAAVWRLPPRMLEIGLTFLLSAPVALVVLYGLSIAGILTE